MLCSLLGRKHHQQCHLAVDASSDHSDFPREMHPLVQEWPGCYRVTNNFLLGSEAFSTERNSHLVLQPGQKPMAKEDTVPSGEATAAVLLNGHDISVKLHLKHLD